MDASVVTARHLGDQGHDRPQEQSRPTADDQVDRLQQLGPYRLEKTIGKGSFGKVKLATDTRTLDKVALKFIHKDKIRKPVQMQRIKREVRLLKILSHPNIVRLCEVSETETEIILVTEYAGGGELFDYIVAQNRLREREARRIFRQIVSAAMYCHSNCIVHRDLKPENLLLDENRNIKIIDFGLSNTFDPDGHLKTFCGSAFYASPEMIVGDKYIGPEVDIWSMGVILYVLLSGHLPFHDDMPKNLYNKIIAGQFSCPPELSLESVDLIRGMLQVDRNVRFTIHQVAHHPWVLEGFDEPPPSFLPLRLPVIEIDPDIVRRVVTYGFAQEETEHAIANRLFHPSVAMYYLMLEKQKRDEAEERQRAENDKARSDARHQRIAAKLARRSQGSNRLSHPLSPTAAAAAAAAGGVPGDLRGRLALSTPNIAAASNTALHYGPGGITSVPAAHGLPMGTRRHHEDATRRARTVASNDMAELQLLAARLAAVNVPAPPPQLQLQQSTPQQLSQLQSSSQPDFSTPRGDVLATNNASNLYSAQSVSPSGHATLSSPRIAMPAPAQSTSRQQQYQQPLFDPAATTRSRHFLDTMSQRPRSADQMLEQDTIATRENQTLRLLVLEQQHQHHEYDQHQQHAVHQEQQLWQAQSLPSDEQMAVDEPVGFQHQDVQWAQSSDTDPAQQQWLLSHGSQQPMMDAVPARVPHRRDWSSEAEAMVIYSNRMRADINSSLSSMPGSNNHSGQNKPHLNVNPPPTAGTGESWAQYTPPEVVAALAAYRGATNPSMRNRSLDLPTDRAAEYDSRKSVITEPSLDPLHGTSSASLLTAPPAHVSADEVSALARIQQLAQLANQRRMTVQNDGSIPAAVLDYLQQQQHQPQRQQSPSSLISTVGAATSQPSPRLGHEQQYHVGVATPSPNVPAIELIRQIRDQADPPGLRCVRGLFNVATSSSRPPLELVKEVTRVLQDNGVQFQCNAFLFNCLYQFLADNGPSPTIGDDVTSLEPPMTAMIRFDIEICRIQNLTMYGLHLNRIDGDQWAYKRLCEHLTGQMRL